MIASLLAEIRHLRPLYHNLLPKWIRNWGFRIINHAVRNQSVIAVRGGCSYHLDLDEVIDHAIFMNMFEPDVTACLTALCQPGMVVLDIGANIGAHALPLAQMAGATGRVYAFEPTEFAYRKLTRNLSLNRFPHASAHRVALSDIDRADQWIDFRSSWKCSGGREQTACRVDFVRLDTFAVSVGLEHIDLIKLDVDGNEYPILKGGIDLLSRSKPAIVLEVVGPHFRDIQTNPLQLLKELGYKFSDFSGRPFASLEEIGRGLDPEDFQMTTSLNLLAQHGQYRKQLP